MRKELGILFFVLLACLFWAICCMELHKFQVYGYCYFQEYLLALEPVLWVSLGKSFEKFKLLRAIIAAETTKEQRVKFMAIAGATYHFYSTFLLRPLTQDYSIRRFCNCSSVCPRFGFWWISHLWPSNQLIYNSCLYSPHCKLSNLYSIAHNSDTNDHLLFPRPWYPATSARR